MAKRDPEELKRRAAQLINGTNTAEKKPASTGGNKTGGLNATIASRATGTGGKTAGRTNGNKTDGKKDKDKPNASGVYEKFGSVMDEREKEKAQATATAERTARSGALDALRSADKPAHPSTPAIPLGSSASRGGATATNNMQAAAGRARLQPDAVIDTLWGSNDGRRGETTMPSVDISATNPAPAEERTPPDLGALVGAMDNESLMASLDQIRGISAEEREARRQAAHDMSYLSAGNIGEGVIPMSTKSRDENRLTGAELEYQQNAALYNMARQAYDQTVLPTDENRALTESEVNTTAQTYYDLADAAEQSGDHDLAVFYREQGDRFAANPDNYVAYDFSASRAQGPLYDAMNTYNSRMKKSRENVAWETKAEEYRGVQREMAASGWEFTDGDYEAFRAQIVNDVYSVPAIAGEGGYTASMALDKYDNREFMTREEASTYWYLRQNYGTAAADEYANFMAPVTGLRRNEQAEEAVRDSGFATQVLMSFTGLDEKVINTLDINLQYVDRKLTGSYMPIDIHTSGTGGRISGAAREEVEYKLGQLGTLGDLVGIHPTEYIPIVSDILDFTLGDAFGLSVDIYNSQANRYMFGNFSGVAMGMQVFSDSAYNAWERGGTNDQIVGYSWLTSIAEGIGETVDYNVLKRNIDRYVQAGHGWKFYAAWGVGALLEQAEGGSQEVVTEIVTRWADHFFMGENSAYNIRVRELMNEGYDEYTASRMAGDEADSELMKTFLLGGLSQSLTYMGSTPAERRRKSADYGRALNSQGNKGLMQEVFSDAAGKTVWAGKSDAKLGRQYEKYMQGAEQMVNDTMRREDAQAVTDYYDRLRGVIPESTGDRMQDMINRARGHADTKNLDAVRKALEKKATGGKLTGRQERLLKNDEHAQQTLKAMESGEVIVDRTNSMRRKEDVMAASAAPYIGLNSETETDSGTTEDTRQRAEAVRANVTIGDQDGMTVNGTEVTEIRGVKNVAGDNTDAVVSVVMADGTTRDVELGDVSFGKKSDPTAISYAAVMSTPELANQFLTAAQNTDMTLNQLATAINHAYEMGEGGFKNIDTVRASVLTQGLDEKTLTRAYQAGVTKFDAKQRAELAAHDARMAKMTGKGWKGGKLDRSAIAGVPLTARQKQQLDLMEVIANRFGVNIQAITGVNPDGSFSGEQGSYNENTNTIRIAINAGLYDQHSDMANVAMLRTLSHELTHSFRRNNFEGYMELRNAVIDSLTARGLDVDKLAQEKIDDRYAADQTVITPDEALDEVVADACETMLRDSDALEQLHKLHPAEAKSFVQRVVDLLRDLAKAIREVFGDAVTTEAKALLEDVEGMANDFGKIAAQWTDTAIEASLNSGREISAGEFTVTSQGAAVANNVAEYMESDNYTPPNNDMLSIRETRAWAKAHKELYPEDETYEENLAMIEDFDRKMAADSVLRYMVPHGRIPKTAKGPLRNNQEYIYTFDMDTKCERTYQFLGYRDAIQKRIGRQLKENESRCLIELMRAYGQMIPCTYCYVEGKRMKLAELYMTYLEKNGGEMMGRTVTAEEVFDTVETARSVVAGYLDSVYNKDENYTVDDTLATDDFEGYRDFTLPVTVDQVAEEVCAKYGVEEKTAKRVVYSFVSEWVYSKRMDVPMNLAVDADYTVDGIDQQTLAFHDAATKAAQGGAKAKGDENYEPYVDQLQNISVEDKKFMVGMGGIRKHSSNDFQIQNVQDYMLFYMDLAADTRGGVRWTGHTYTKNLDYARIFAPTNDRINVSIAMYGDFKSGITPNTQEGVDWREIQEIRKQYKNVGAMAMVTNNDQLSYALNSDWIDMIIPFHASGMRKDLYRDVLHWLDYTSKQSEKPFNKKQMIERLREKGVTVKSTAKAAEVKQLFDKTFNVPVLIDEKTGKRKAPHFFPRDTEKYGTTIPGHNNDAQRYFELCEQYGVNPRFKGIKVQGPDGNMIDVTEHPNYLKLIKETARTDTPQEPIVAKFDTDRINKAMAEFKQVGGYDNLKQDAFGIVDEFIEEYAGQNRKVGWLTKRAVETREILQKMSAAERDKYAKQRLAMQRKVNETDNRLAGAERFSPRKPTEQDLQRMDLQQIDDGYMQAIKDGANDEQLLAYIRAVAIKKGYNPLKIYHGTKNFGHTSFDLGKSEFGISIFATNEWQMAQGYTGGRSVVRKAGSVNRVDDAWLRTASAEDVANELRQLGYGDATAVTDEKAAATIAKSMKSLTRNVEDLKAALEDAADAAPDVIDSRNVEDVVKLLDALKTADYNDPESATFGRDMRTLTTAMKGITKGLRANKATRAMAEEVRDVFDDISFDVDSLVSMQGSERITLTRDGETRTIQMAAAKRIIKGEGIGGVYELFGKTDGMLVVEGAGAQWNKLDGAVIGKPGENVKTDDIAAYAKENDYKGVRIKDIYDYDTITDASPTGDVYVFFEPSSVKSADPITYDKKGNIIPPSQRFNAKETDIRFSTRKGGTTDVGKMTDKQLATGYMDAYKRGDETEMRRMLDEYAVRRGYNSGHVYHGTQSFGFDEFKLTQATFNTSVFVTDDLDTAMTYTRWGGVSKLSDKVNGVDDMTTEELVEAFKSVIGGEVAVVKSKETRKYYDYVRDELAKKMQGDMLGFMRSEAILAKPAIKAKIEAFEGMLNSITAKASLPGRLAFAIQRNAITKAALEIERSGPDGADYMRYAMDAYRPALDKMAAMISGKELLIGHDGKSVTSVYDVNTLRTRLKSALRRGDKMGIYDLYVRTDGLFVVDANGKEWNELDGAIIGRPGTYVKTDEVAGYAQQHGYEGVTFKNIKDHGGQRAGKSTASAVMALFKPNNIKSADTVTYDSNGMVIPLEQRFDENKNSIRYQARRAQDISDRELLVNILAEGLRNEDEHQLLNRYQDKMGELKNIQQELDDVRARITEWVYMPQLTSAQKAQLTKDRNRADELADELASHDRELLGMQALTPLRNVLDRARAQIMERAAADHDYEVELDKSERKAMRDEYNQRLQDMRTERIQMREEFNKRLEGMRANNAARLQRMRDTRDSQMLRRSVLRKANAISKKLVGPGDKNHLPESVKKPALDLMQTFASMDKAFGSGRDAVYKLETLRRAYDKLRTNVDGMDAAYGDYASSRYDDDIAARLETLSDVVREHEREGLMALNASELRMVNEIMDHFQWMISSADKEFVLGKQVKTDQVLEGIYNQMFDFDTGRIKGSANRNVLRKLADPKNNWLHMNMLTPTYFFEMMGGEFEKLGKTLIEGETTYARNRYKAKQKLVALQKKYHRDSWVNKRGDTIKLVLEDGDELELTREQALGIWATAKRERSADIPTKHLEEGGVILDKNAAKPGFMGALKNTSNIGRKLTKGDINKISNWLTDEQKQYADEMVKYVSTDMAKLGNETSMDLHGYRKFTVGGFYYPFKTPRDFVRTDPNKKGDTAMWKNEGFTKMVQKGATTPVMITDFTDTIASHVDRMCKYNALAVPQDMLMRIMNYRPRAGFANTSVKQLVNDYFGELTHDYLLTFIGDVHDTGGKSGRIDEKVMRMLSMSKRNSVMGSASVAIQQPSAIVRAFAMINPIYFRGLVRSPKLFEEAMQYSGTAVLKDAGGFDMHSGSSANDWVLGRTDKKWASDSSVWENLTDLNDKVWSAAPEFMDKITWAAIWQAVKAEQAAKTGLNIDSEELKTIAGKRYDDVIRHTQVYDSVMAKSQAMRGGPMDQYFTSFMAEPTVTYNMMSKAMLDLAHGEVRKASSTVLAVALSIIYNNALKAVVTGARDDDDEEATYRERWYKNFISGMINDINPANYVFIVRDAWSLLNGYSADRSEYAVIEQGMKFVKTALDEDASTKDVLKEGAKLLGYITPIPAGNVWRDVEAGVNTFNTISETHRGERELREGWGRNALREALSENLPAINPVKEWIMPSRDAKMFDAALDGDTEAVANYRRELMDFEGLDDKAVDNKFRERVRKAYVSGEIDAGTAKGLLLDNTELYGDEIDEYLAEWDYSIAYEGKKYSGLKELFLDSDMSVDEAAERITTYGLKDPEDAALEARKWDYERKTGRKYSDLYRDYARSENITREEYKTALMDVEGLTEEEAEKKALKADCQLVTGYKYDQLDEAYMSGEITADQYIEYRYLYGGVSRETSRANVSEMNYELDTSRNYSELDEDYVNGEIDRPTYLATLQEYEGLTPSKAEKKALKLDYRMDTDLNPDGYTYADLADNYVEGNIDADHYEQALIRYGGYDADDAHAARRKLDYEVDTGYVYSEMRDDVERGTLTPAEAKKYRAEYGGQTDNEAYWDVEGWVYEIEGRGTWRGKYTRVYDGIEAGNLVTTKKAIDEIYAHSDSDDTYSAVNSALTSEYKPIYINLPKSKRGALENKLIPIYEYNYKKSGKKGTFDADYRRELIQGWLEED